RLDALGGGGGLDEDRRAAEDDLGRRGDEAVGEAERADARAVRAAEVLDLDAVVRRAELAVERAHAPVLEDEVRAGIAPHDDGIDVDGDDFSVGRADRAAAHGPVHRSLNRGRDLFHRGQPYYRAILAADEQVDRLGSRGDGAFLG